MEKVLTVELKPHHILQNKLVYENGEYIIILPKSYKFEWDEPIKVVIEQ